MGRPACKAREAALAAAKLRYWTGRPCANGHLAERQTSNATCIECRNEKEAKRRLQARSVAPYKRDPRARAEAKAAGAPFYRTEIPCINGHLAERFTSNGLCTVCFREWFGKNRERLLAKMAEYRRSDPEAVSAGKRRSRQKNPQKYIAYTKKWEAENPERARLNRKVGAHRRRKKIEASTMHHTANDVQRILKEQQGKCAYCRVSLNNGYRIDHIVPIAKGGTNAPANVQLTCAPCNFKKAAKDPLTFAAELGLLL